MAETRLIRDHHLLTRNLKLNGNYISNDGGDEGISIADDGDVTMTSNDTQLKVVYDGSNYADISVADDGHLELATTGTDGDITLDSSSDIYLEATTSHVFLGPTIDFDLNGTAGAGASMKFMSVLDTGDYFMIDTTLNGATTITTVDDDGEGADLILNIDGYIDLNSASGENITLDSGAAINLEPAAGSVILLDSTVSVDAGVITGVTDLAMVSTATTGIALNVQATALTTGNALKLFVDDSLTSASDKVLVNIDYDKSGVTGGLTVNKTTGLAINMADAATNNISAVINMIGIQIDMDLANVAGSNFQKGIVLNVGADSVGDASDARGIEMEIIDGGIDIKCNSSADTSDYFAIQTTTAGATTISTVDSDDGEEANLTFDIQGDIIFKGDIADGTSTEVFRLDSSASSLLMASSKKIELGAAEEYIYGDTTDIHFGVGSGGDINIPANIGLTFGDDISNSNSIEGDGTNLTIASSGHVEFDGCGVGFDKISYTDATNVTVDFTTGNKAELDMAGGSIADTLSLKFPDTSGNFLLVVKQDGSTRTIAAFATLDSAGNAGDNDGGTGGAVRWAGGSAPDLTDGSNKDDILTFYWDADLEVCYGVATLNF
jgi:hypothetical protein